MVIESSRANDSRPSINNWSSEGRQPMHNRRDMMDLRKQETR